MCNDCLYEDAMVILVNIVDYTKKGFCDSIFQKTIPLTFEIANGISSMIAMWVGTDFINGFAYYLLSNGILFLYKPTSRTGFSRNLKWQKSGHATSLPFDDVVCVPDSCPFLTPTLKPNLQWLGQDHQSPCYRNYVLRPRKAHMPTLWQGEHDTHLLAPLAFQGEALQGLNFAQIQKP